MWLQSNKIGVVGTSIDKQEKDILKLIPPPKTAPKLTARRIGIHTSTAGGVANAAERAYRLGCNTLQIFSSSPRQWKPYELAGSQCDEMSRLRERYELKPLVIHANYLVNLAGGNRGVPSPSRSSPFAERWSVRWRSAPNFS